MKTKKVISMLVAIVMLFACTLLPASAETQYAMGLAFSGEKTIILAGDTLVVEILADSKGDKVDGVGFTLNYNKDLFDFVTEGGVEGVACPGATVISIGEGKLQGSSMFDKTAYTTDSPWAKVSFVAKTVTEITEASFALALNEDSKWARPDTQSTTNVDFGSAVTIDVAPARDKAPTFNVEVSGTAVSGGTVEAAITNFDDPWKYAWDNSEKVQWTYTWTNGKTGKSITLDANDYVDSESTIGVSATATIVGAPTNNTATIVATPVKVTLPDTAPTFANADVSTADVPAVGAELDALKYVSATADTYVGGDIAYTYAWKVKGDAATGMNGATSQIFKPDTLDFEAAADSESALTCVVTATSRNGKTAEATITFTSKIVAGNMAPSVEDLAIKVKDQAVEYAVVDDELVVSYTWKDVADEEDEDETYVTDDPDSNASTIAWKIDGEVVSTENTFKVTKELRGKNITVEVTPISLDTTPNDKIGTEENPYDVVNGKVESKTIAIKANPNYVPTVSNVYVPSVEIIWDKPFEVDWAFEDKNGYADESVLSFLYGDGTDASAVITNNGNGTYTIASDKKETIGEKTIKFRVQATKSAAATADGVSYVPELKYVDSKEYTVIEAVSSGSGSIKNPTLGGGGTTPTVSPQPTTTPEPTDAPVVVPAAKDCITLTIGKTDVNVFGDAKANDVAPVIRNDRTMLPARIVAEALGAEVAWDGEARKVTITKGDVTIVITIDADKALVNGEEVALDSHAFIEKDRTYLPMRFLGEKLGAEVTWNAATQEVYIVPGK